MAVVKQRILVPCRTPATLVRASGFFRQREGGRSRDFGDVEDLQIGDDFVACVVIAATPEALKRKISGYSHRFEIVEEPS